MEEGIFDEVAQLIDIFIIFPLFLAVSFGGNNGLHALIFCLFQDIVGIVCAIGQQVFRRNALNQPASNRAIRSGTLRNNHSDWHTMRIHGQVYLAVEPPFVRLMS